jgi:hypothetical protein
MKIVRSFLAPISEVIVRERFVTFLTEADYRQQPDSNGYLHFRRGSNVGAISSFNPRKWAAEVYIRIKSEGNSSEIYVKVKMSSDPTEKRFAEELLTAEFDLLEAAVTLGEFKTYDVSALKKKIATHFYRVVGIFASFIFSVILGVVAGLFIYVNFNFSEFAASATGAGILLLMAAIFLILWRKQKKTDL